MAAGLNRLILRYKLSVLFRIPAAFVPRKNKDFSTYLQVFMDFLFPCFNFFFDIPPDKFEDIETFFLKKNFLVFDH